MLGRQGTGTKVQKCRGEEDEQRSRKNSLLIPKVVPTGEKAVLTFPDGKSIELDILQGSEGPRMVDIKTLYSKTGHFTYDPGYTATGSCASAITFIDGDKGELWYRGYPIEQLAESSNFMEVCYLLLYGELPGPNEKELFEHTIKDEMLIHEQLIEFYKGFQTGAHPMAIMVGVVGALSSFMHDGLDIHDAIEREHTAIRMVAKFPMIAAIAYRTSVGLPIVYPRADLSYSENFLYMMFHNPMNQEFSCDPVFARAMDIIFTLHADHEQNASTSTVRIAGSSAANPYACIAAGIASLWGPAHGGANEAVLDMLEKIGSVENIPAWVAKAKDKNDPFRLMGFGHRVYKNRDPRAAVMQQMCHQVLEKLGKGDDPLFKLAMELEQIALKDEYFIARKLYPNVDFYSGIVLRAMGIPTSMFTVIFAMSRCIGWITQWREMISEPTHKIGRPRQLYVGQKKRDFISVQNRDDVSRMSETDSAGVFGCLGSFNGAKKSNA